MSTGTFYKNASTRHSIYVQRFAGGEARKLEKYIQRVRKDLKKRLKKENLTTIKKVQLKALLKDLNNIATAQFSVMSTELERHMKEFGLYEGDFSARMLSKGSTAEFVSPAVTSIEAALKTTKLELGVGKAVTLKAATEQYSKAKGKEIARIVKDGVITGQTTEETLLAVDRLVAVKHKRQLRALVQTTANQISNLSRQLTIEKNSDIVDRVQWVATLDGSTTAQCASLDGKTFPINSGPRPPLHWNCRSTVIPVVKKQFQLPIKIDRPAVGSKGVESVGGTTTYNSWLKTQPKSFQIDALGPTKAKLFRDGGLLMDKFVDTNYQELSLKQLKRKEPAAFERAGLT